MPPTAVRLTRTGGRPGAGLPADHPVRLYAAAEMAKLEQLGFTGEVRGTPEQPGMEALPSVSEHEQPRYIPGATRG